MRLICAFLLLPAFVIAQPTIAPAGVVQSYATGLGPVANTPKSGAAPDPTLTAPLLSTTITAPTATIGDAPATVAFAGLAPQIINAAYAGLYEVDIQIPPTAATGSAVPIILSSNGTVSNTATIAIDSTPAPLLASWIQFGPG